jgi:hypothetical protein
MDLQRLLQENVSEGKAGCITDIRERRCSDESGLALRIGRKSAPTNPSVAYAVWMSRKGERKSTIKVLPFAYHRHDMNRGTAPSARPLTLTEELEKLEQSITLTLQGICSISQQTAEF